MRPELPLREITTQEVWQEVQRLRTDLKTHNHLTFGSQLLSGEVNGILQSPNFISGSSGYQILPSGSVEFNQGYFRGDLVIGSGNNIIIADPDHATYRFWIGHATDPTSAGFAVEKTGILHATGAIISGSITGSELHIPDENTTANSFHADTDGNTWWGCTHTNFDADHDNAAAFVLATGAAKFQSITLETNVVIKDLQAGSVVEGSYINALNVSQLVTGTISSKAITLAVTPGGGDVYLNAGKTDFDNTQTGFILGIDDSDSDLPKFFIGTSTYYFNFDGANVKIKAQSSNLMMYDCVVDAGGDGDYTTLGAAVTAGQTSIFVRAGSYTETGNITLAADTTIIGEDWDTTEVTLAGYTLSFSNDDITIKNITFFGSYNGFQLTGSGDDVLFEQVRVDVPSSSNWHSGINSSGIRFRLIGCEVLVSSNVLTASGNNALIDRCRFYGGRNDTDDGYNANEVSLTGDDAYFVNNHFERTNSGGNYSGGLVIGGDRTVVMGNYIYEDGGDTFGISISTDKVDTKIIGNTIRGWGDAIYCGTYYRYEIANNSIIDPADDGIISIGATNAGYGYRTINGNVIWNPGGSGITGSMTRVVITGNAIYSAGEDGIKIPNTDSNAFYLTITGNYIGECAGHGINVCGGSASYDGTYFVIVGNQIQACSGTGMYLRIDRSTVVGNVSWNNGTNWNVTDTGSSTVANNDYA